MPVFVLAFFLASVLAPTACRHESIDDNNGDPIDTIPHDTVPLDTVKPTGVPCDPDTVYFQNSILPLLVSNCAKSDCHDAASHQEGIYADSYQHILNTIEGVTSTNWNNNDLVRLATTTNQSKRMPPPPAAALTTDQINLIKTWVQQGAKNNGCNENYTGCDTASVSFSAFIKPLMTAKCTGCHSASSPQGNISLVTYDQVRAQALNGKLYTSISKTTGFMPKGGVRLDDCTIGKIKAWVDAGAKNN